MFVRRPKLNAEAGVRIPGPDEVYPARERRKGRREQRKNYITKGRRQNWWAATVVVQYEFLMASSLVDGVILSVAVLQAERRLSRYDTVCNGRSLGPLVKTRALRDDALRDSDSN